MDYREFIGNFLEEHRQEFTHISDEIWGYAEPRFREYRSSALQQEYMKDKGFSVRADLAGEETAFIAEYGKGRPVIAFLGEFDSLSGLSQEADVTVHTPIVEGGEGHGCGHNLLGTASLAATVVLKAYMDKEGLEGTIRYYGCPAEENAGGKAYLVRDGYFDDCDIALTWHPGTINSVTGDSSLANFRVFFTFYGISSHAAGAPELGRSALDAVELMDVGVNYLREHVISDARIHYAITNSGGKAPNVVQSEAQVLYAIRAPKVSQVKEIYERIKKIAQGAALMTETDVDIKQVAAYSNSIPNDVIAANMLENLKYYVPSYTKEELAYAEGFKAVITDLDRAGLKETAINKFGREEGLRQYEKPIFDAIAPYRSGGVGKASTDVGDVSWIVPTCECNTACWAAGTAGHSWQVVAQGKSSIAHKGMLAAAKTMAATGFEFLTSPELVAKARENWLEMLDGEKYPDPLPADAKPEMW